MKRVLLGWAALMMSGWGLQSLGAQEIIPDPVQFTNSSNTDFSVLIKNSGKGAKGLSIEGGNSGSDAELLKVTNWDGTRTFLTVTDDRVGIGTSVPGAPFTIVKPDFAPSPFYDGLAFIHQSSNPDGSLLKPALELRNGGGSGYGLVSHARNNYFSGSLGIGVDLPLEAIDLGSMRKNIRIEYTHLGEVGSSGGTVLGNNLRASVTTNRQLEVASHDVTAMHALYMKHDSGWHFLSLPSNHGYPVGAPVDLNANTKLRITTDGSLGIGTINPNHKLEVNGTIRAKEIIVDTNWPDYVFEEGYELMSLDDVDLHIREHGRLPGLPSAEQVARHGLALADSQRLLLEKIEELTLHQIRQERILSEQQELLRMQSQELARLRVESNEN